MLPNPNLFPMNIKEMKKYGQFLVDFANADGTENAVLACFNNLQQNFSFPPDFYDMVKNLYPSLNVISALLSNADKKLLEQILIKSAILTRLNEQFKPINYAIENYDPLSRTVSLMSLEWNRDSNGGISEDNQIGHDDPGGGGFLQTLKLLGLSIVDGPVTIQIDVVKGEIKSLLGSQAADQLNQLMEVGHVIEDLFTDLDEGRYEELHLLAEEHREVIYFHNKIGGVQTDCRQTLDMVIEGRPFREIPPFANFLNIYNNAGARQLTIDDNNRLVAGSPVEEGEYLAIKEIDGWFEVLQKDIAYCLIEFFKSEKSRNYLKKCRTCRRYFMASQPKIQKFCTTQCRLDRPDDQAKTSDEKPSGHAEHQSANRDLGSNAIQLG